MEKGASNPSRTDSRNSAGLSHCGWNLLLARPTYVAWNRQSCQPWHFLHRAKLTRGLPSSLNAPVPLFWSKSRQQTGKQQPIANGSRSPNQLSDDAAKHASEPGGSFIRNEVVSQFEIKSGAGREPGS
jgi:hypothetical protein